MYIIYGLYNDPLHGQLFIVLCDLSEAVSRLTFGLRECVLWHRSIKSMRLHHGTVLETTLLNSCPKGPYYKAFANTRFRPGQEIYF